jgi:SAM-dependent methyltransferase
VNRTRLAPPGEPDAAADAEVAMTETVNAPHDGDWFEDEEYWRAFAPVLFGASRWEAAATQVTAILERTGCEPGGAVLDLCCGPGRHSLELARRGYDVTGVDRTVRYLEEARTRAAAEGLAVTFVQEDMRRFRRAGSYDLALNLFTSFGFFEDPEDDRIVARNVLESLRPGGAFVMEMSSREILAMRFTPRDWFWVDDAKTIPMLEERVIAEDWGSVRMTWAIMSEGQWIRRTLRLRLYTGTELARLLKDAGFASVSVHGGLDWSPYDNKAKRLVVVARKGAAGERASA